MLDYYYSTMTRIPQPAWSNVLSYLHREYDWEKAQLMRELTAKCKFLGEDTDDIMEFVPSLMLPTKCIWSRVQSRYRCYSQEWALGEDKCTCGYCKAGLWSGIK